MLDRISAILAFAKGPDVLDVGCAGGLQDIGDLDPTRTRSDPAYGRWLHGHLARQFDGLVGIDINEKKVAAMRSLGYEVVVGNAQDIGLNRTFDTIVAGELIEHLFDPGAFLQSAARHLKPGGRLVLSTPYPMGLPNVLYAWIKYPKTCSNPEHTMWLCPSTLTVLARGHGLDMVKWEPAESYRRDVGGLYGIVLRIWRGVRWAVPARMRANCYVAILVSERPNGSDDQHP